MQFTVTVDQESNSSELSALSAFIHNIACLRGNAVSAKEVVHVEEVKVVAPEESGQAAGDDQVVEPVQTVRRTRRTKAEVKAETAPEKTEESADEIQAVNVVAEVPAQESVATESPVDTVAETASVDPVVVESAPATTDVVESEAPQGEPARTYSQTEVQMIASEVARRIGPEKVKALIAEFKVERIAALSGDELNKFAERLKVM